MKRIRIWTGLLATLLFLAVLAFAGMGAKAAQLPAELKEKMKPGDNMSW